MDDPVTKKITESHSKTIHRSVKDNLMHDGSENGNEPEEGEIIDEYDYIISSDEELNMRQRIKQLEITNLEIGQISRISETCEYDYLFKNMHSSNINNPEFVDTENVKKINPSVRFNVHDAFSNSSVELGPIKRQKLRRKKHKKSKLQNRNHNTCNKSKNCLRNQYNFRALCEKELETISLNSSENEAIDRKINSEDKIYENFIEDESMDEINFINREELRFALARPEGTPRNVNLKELLQKELKNKELKPSLVREEENFDNVPSDNSEEQELRLIALKSAVIKKHLARKKRNEQLAYSPTDFEDLLGGGNNADDIMELVDVDLDEIHAGMDITPEASPKLLLSPEREICNLNCDLSMGISDSSYSNDNKLVDMDIVNSESDDDDRMSYFGQRKNNMMLKCDSLDYTTSMNDEVLVSNMKFQIEPPPLQPGPIFSSLCSFNDQSSNNCVVLNIQANITDKEVKITSPVKQIEYKTDLTSNQINISENTQFENDEEEEALRALLLSKFQVNKAYKNIANQHANVNDVFTFKTNTLPVATNYEAQATSSGSDEKPTESILKKAVRRLKTKLEKHNAIDVDEVKENDHHEYNLNEQCTTSDLALGQSHTVPNEINIKESNKNLENKNEEQRFMNNHITIVKDKPEICAIETNKLISNSSLDPKLKNEHLITRYSDRALTEKVQKKANVEKTIATHSLLPSKLNTFNSTIYPKTDKNASVTKNSHFQDTKRKLLATKSPMEKRITNKLKKTPTNENVQKKLSTNLIPKKLSKRLSIYDKPVPIPSKRSSKIIKRNKIINCMHETNRKLLKALEVQKTSSLTLQNVGNNSRLISSTDLPAAALKVQKLVISLNDSDNETSEDEVTRYRFTNDIIKNLEKQTHRNECNDPNKYPNTSSSQVSSVTMNFSKNYPDNKRSQTSAVNNCFEEKLDSFLRDIRSKVQPSSDTGCPKSKVLKGNGLPDNSHIRNLSSPSAVCNLPEAFQQEYRRLVERMKKLEREKRYRRKNNNANKCQKADYMDCSSSSCFKEEKSLNNIVKSCLVPANQSIISTKDNKSYTVSKVSTQKPAKSFQKSHPGDELLETICPATLTSYNTHETSKIALLEAYEDALFKVGHGIISNLDKSLLLVEQAKTSKIDKLIYGKRIKELRLEMDTLQLKCKREQDNISKIYPKICNTNEIITSLKQKRAKLIKVATQLGKNINGTDYRFENDLGQEIMFKIKKLATDIKYVNSISVSDIHKGKTTEIPDESSPENKGNHCISITHDKCTNVNRSQYIQEKSFELEKKAEKNVQHTDISAIPKNNMKPSNIGLPSDLNMEVNKEDAEIITFNDNKKDFDGISIVKETIPTVGVNAESKEGSSLLSLYRSPLSYQQYNESLLDPNGVLCPYELMGQCEDSDCKFTHLRKAVTV